MRRPKPSREEIRAATAIEQMRQEAADALNACIDIRRPPRTDLFYIDAIARLRAAQRRLALIRFERYA